MGQVRIIPEAETVLNQAQSETDLEIALLMVSLLLDKPFLEESHPVKSDMFTGDPVEIAWRPLNKWSGQISDMNCRLSQTLLRLVPSGEMRGARLSTGKTLVISHVPMQNFDRGATPAHFLIRYLSMISV